MNASFDVLLPKILLDAPDCPELVASEAIRASSSEFCTNTWVWRDVLNTINTTAGEPSYSLPVPTGTKSAGIIGATFDGRPLEPLSMVRLDNKSITWRNETGSQPQAYMDDAMGNVRLYPTPENDSVTGLVVVVALTPSLSSMDIPEHLLELWGDTIADGALMRLTAMPGKPWSSPGLSVAYRRDFYAGIGEAKSLIRKGATSGLKMRRPKIA